MTFYCTVKLRHCDVTFVLIATSHSRWLSHRRWKRMRPKFAK